MAESNHKPQEFYDKPPPYSPVGGGEYPNAYAPGVYTQQPPQGAPQQPHISAPPPPVGYHVGPTITIPNYGTTVPVYGAATHTQIIVVGGCPACRMGVLEDEFTCCGICLGILLFPLGLLCCLAMRQRRCPNCGAIFG